MKFTKLAAGTAGLALVAGASLLGAAPASAADIDVVIPTPIPEENPAGYDPTWFAGNVTGGHGTAVQDSTGLVITGGANGFQLLNGSAEDDASLTLSAALDYQSVSASGDAFYQISVFGEPTAEFTTLRPVVATEPWGDWEVSRAVAGLVVGDSYTKAELIAALDGGATAAKVLAFGVFVNPGDTVTLRGLTFVDDSYLFAAKPTLAVAPTSLQLSERTKPVTLSAAGFLPGEDVYIGYGGESFGDLLDVVTAGPDGTVTYVVDVSTFELGAYTFSVSDEGGVLWASAGFTIAPNVLAATGIELTGGLVGAGVLLAAGAVFLVLRRRATHTA